MKREPNCGRIDYRLDWYKRCMDEAIAMQIVGAVCLLIGLKMNIDPKGFNEDIFGKEAPESALGEMNAMRMAIGGGVLAVSAINLICSFTMNDADSMAALLTASAVGLAIFFATVVGANLRGYTEAIPKLPAIVLPILVAVSLVGAFV
jgi:hypothetical protein